MERIIAEYIWLDGYTPTANPRSKWKVLDRSIVSKIKDIPEWGFDGSSTEQAPGDKSDCILNPVAFYPDPIRGRPHVLTMCEVMLADGSPHQTNTRAALRQATEAYARREPLFGVEQEYTLLREGRIAGWPAAPGSYPQPQGKYYCGVGADNVAGRRLVEEHLKACLNAGLRYSGGNAEVLLGQWEYQIGPLGPVELGDQTWVARWLLARLGENHGLSVSLDPKPVEGDWNGTGGHINFSTKEMRSPGGIGAIERACGKLQDRHDDHIAVYGSGNDRRLTGLHETCGIDTFRWGVSDRGASIRIPLATARNGCGYLEDRRPAANMDPYVVCLALLETVLGNGFKAP